MNLRGIRFKPVQQASGATNFFGPGRGKGHGWWYHRLLYPFGLDFSEATFVSKTTTLHPRPGNMPLKKDGVTPMEWIPKCIIVDRQNKAVLNAVSLSGPGLEALLLKGGWRELTSPFFISVMSLAPTPTERLAEFRAIFACLSTVKRFEYRRAYYWGIQINLSCPNGGVDPNALIEESIPVLDLANTYLQDSIPVMLKFGPEANPSSMLRIVKHSRCDAIHFCNTMPFGKYPTWAEEARVPPVDWMKLYGTDNPKKSPMQKRFPGFAGGYSGAKLLPFVLTWVHAVRSLGITTPICGGGGVLSGDDGCAVIDAGADAVSFGSIAMLAPAQVRRSIRKTHHYALVK